MGGGLARLVIGASGAAGWLLACATVPVVPIDRPDVDDASAEAAPDAADAADAQTLDADLDADG